MRLGEAMLLIVMAAPGGCTAPAVRPVPPARPTPAATATASPTGAAAIVAPGEARVGDRTLCLISDEEFVVTASSPKVEHEGKTYYFCCPGCDSDFKKSPEKYLRKIH